MENPTNDDLERSSSDNDFDSKTDNKNDNEYDNDESIE